MEWAAGLDALPGLKRSSRDVKPAGDCSYLRWCPARVQPSKVSGFRGAFCGGEE